MRTRRTLTSFVLLTLLAGVAGLPASASELPSLRLFAVSHTVTVRHFEEEPIFPAQFGVWVTSDGGGFELRVSRADYRTPVGIVQVDPETGQVLRELPADVLDGWRGLKEFTHFVIKDQAGSIVHDSSMPFCGNSFEKQRVNDEGPPEPFYPEYCGANAFTMGMVWGIEEGWASSIGSSYDFANAIHLPDGRYTVEISVAERYREMFAMPADGASVALDVTVETIEYDEFGPDTKGGSGRLTDAPSTNRPHRNTVPDLTTTPAWAIVAYRQGRRDMVSFAATAWNRGPGPLIVEGFRNPEESVMSAYQYFYDGEEATGRAEVGSFQFDPRDGHDHWHFRQFVRYELVDPDTGRAVRSKKQAFCLAPTDGMDLTVPNAAFRPHLGFHSSCGYEGAIWIREVLPVGWGDTYFQFVPGQSFDVTNLPNGHYDIRITVNPNGRLFDRDRSNDVSLRRIRLRGTPGSRNVVVPPWYGIDSESGAGCLFCF